MQQDIQRLRHKFREGRSALYREVSWDTSCQGLLEAHTALVDGILKEIYEISCQAADRVAARSVHSGIAIVATGGYGRRELHPFSDIDIAFLPSEEEDPWGEALVHAAFKLVMDVFLSLREVRVGYAFRPIADANSWDVQTKTALLDLRHVCGDNRLSERLALRIREVLSPLDLMLESEANRKLGFTHSLYSVEPSLKEGPGSLRDLHFARWIFKLLLGVADHALDHALTDHAGISSRQIAEVHEAVQWFWRARTWMHLAAGKCSDVLITNYQDRMARQLDSCPAQEWLSRHIAHSEVLAHFRETAVQTLLQGPFIVNGVCLEDGSLHRQVSASVSATGMLLLAQRYSIPVSLVDQKRMEEGRERALDVRDASGEELRAFTQILSGSQGIASTLRTLSDVGILDRFIPNFSKVMRFVPPDPAHRYTVGEHSMRMIEHLERLRAGEDSPEQRYADLLRQCPHFDMLCLAALIHDAGKLYPGEDHCSTGAELARSVSVKLNLPSEKREILHALVRQHLSLVRTARLHDLKSAHVVRQAVEQVPSLEVLHHLYVFTYVDTSAVAEKNWTSMDDRDLEDLYKRMMDHLARSDESSEHEAQEDRSILIRKKLAALQAKGQTAILEQCDAMPASYVLNTPLEEIAFHLQLIDRLETERVVLDVYNRPGDDYSELTICTFDDPQPGMLAKITGVLYGCNVDIHKAQAFTIEMKRPVVLDSLWIRCNGMQISENKARRIQSTLKEVLTGARSIEDFLDRAGKRPPDGIGLDAIDLRNDLSEEHTVVHLVAQDLQGLLYLMTRSLSRCGLDIHAAKIATWNARAENNFYVTASAGGQIPDAELPVWTEQLAGVLRGDGARA